MQSMQWYAQRLAAMSTGEILWRIKIKAREFTDRYVDCVRRSTGRGRSLARRAWSSVIRAQVAVPFPSWIQEQGPARPWVEAWRREAVRRADRICDHRIDLFDLVGEDLGPRINWNFDYKSRVPAPLRFSPGIDYRDHRVTGDAKFVWELNRHQHLVVLGRAFMLTGEPAYARRAVEMIEDWVGQCPYGKGMNWRSPLELAIRLINWVWVYELITGSGAVTPAHGRLMLPVIDRHLWSISRGYSHYSSANNHLVGEAAGVFIGASYFPGLKRSAKWRRESKAILNREIHAQVHDDGGHRELAAGYHLFVLEFFLLAGLVARNSGDDFPREYWRRLESMFEYVATLLEGGDRLPMFGDGDDGYVLNLGGGGDYARRLLAVGAAVFQRSDLLPTGAWPSEPAAWLTGWLDLEAFAPLRNGRCRQAIRSTALPDSGYYLLQDGHQDAPDRISLTFDCGELGFGSLAAHGHADALSFTLRAFGVEVFIDPGTYDYFSFRPWRDYFRSTAAHNTIVVDGQDQSERLGLFLWGRRARAECLRWEPSPDGGTVCGEHDGYTRLPDPVTHRRTVTLKGQRGEIIIRDELSGQAPHRAELYLHLAEHCSVEERDAGEYLVRAGPGEIIVQLDPRMSVRTIRGSEDPLGGWVSRGYHRKTPTTTMVGACQWEGRISLVTRILIGRVERRRMTDDLRSRDAIMLGDAPALMEQAGGYVRLPPAEPVHVFGRMLARDERREE
ncbi:MAG: hypothetical protein AMXMBFR83_07930 [Phycisphaerae bacterium]